jgi:hypothetical protein
MTTQAPTRPHEATTQQVNTLRNTATRTLIEAARERAYDEALGKLTKAHGASSIPPLQLKLEVLRVMREDLDIIIRTLEVEL